MVVLPSARTITTATGRRGSSAGQGRGGTTTPAGAQAAARSARRGARNAAIRSYGPVSSPASRPSTVSQRCRNTRLGVSRPFSAFVIALDE